MISKNLAHLLCLLFPVMACFAQDKKPEDEIPRAIIADVAKINPDGGMLFAVRIFAPRTKTLELFQRPEKDAPQPGAVIAVRPFSLDGSSLKDLYSEKVYKNLPSLPSSPFVGPMDVTTELQPGGWVQLGVAFPPIPAPALDKDGKKQPYQLLLEIPKLKISTVVKLDPDSLKAIEGIR